MLRPGSWVSTRGSPEFSARVSSRPSSRRGCPASRTTGHIARVHRPDEYLDVSELLDQTRMYALTALALCGAANAGS